MIVQSAAAYASAQAFSRQMPQRQTLFAASAVSADAVTISQAARDRLAASAQPRSCASIHRWATDAAHADPAQAEDMAELFANINDMPLVDISESVNGTGPIRYAATGEPVTQETEAWFLATSESVKAGRLALYNTEKAKGTPAADILDKIFAYNDAQPARYKELMAWSVTPPNTM